MRACMLTVLGVLTVASVVSAEVLLTDDFEGGIGPWNTFTGGAAPTIQREVSRSGAALESRYTLTTAKKIHAIGRTVEFPPAGAESVRCWVRTSAEAVLIVVLAEQDGSRYQTLVHSPGGVWQDVHIGLDHFRLADDAEDENEQLDTDQIAAFAVGDVSMHMPVVDDAAGERRLWLDDLSIATDPAPNAYSANGQLPYLLDSFESGYLGWFAVDGQVTHDAKKSVLEWDYDGLQKENRFCAVITSLGPLPATGATHLLLTLRAKRLTQLVVVLQEEKRPGRPESRYAYLLEVAAGDDFTTYAVPLDEMQLDTDNGGGDDNNQLDLDQVGALILGDVEAITGQAPGENTLWIDEIELIGT